MRDKDKEEMDYNRTNIRGMKEETEEGKKVVT